MTREQDDMKGIAITIITILLTVSAYSQNATGGWVAERKDSSEGYYFWEDGQFIWFRFANDKKEYGEGTYTHHGDTVTLKFARARRKFDLKSSGSFPNNTKKAIVEISAITSGGRPVQGVRSVLKKSGVTAITNASGISKIEIANPVINDEILFDILGYEGHGTVDTSISLQGQTNFFIISIDDQIVYKEHQELNIGLQRVGRSTTIARDDEKKIYSKISKSKFLDLYHRVEANP